jgi:hypothetical protein
MVIEKGSPIFLFYNEPRINRKERTLSRDSTEPQRVSRGLVSLSLLRTKYSVHHKSLRNAKSAFLLCLQVSQRYYRIPSFLRISAYNLFFLKIPPRARRSAPISLADAEAQQRLCTSCLQSHTTRFRTCNSCRARNKAALQQRRERVREENCLQTAFAITQPNLTTNLLQIR